MPGERKNSRHILHCSYCARPFNFPSDLKRHEMTHTGERSHECAVCGFGSIMFSGIVNHLKKLHPREMALMIKEFGLVVAKKSDAKMALAKDIFRSGRFGGNAEKRQMNNDHRGLEDRAFDSEEFGGKYAGSGIAEKYAGNTFPEKNAGNRRAAKAGFSTDNKMAHYVVCQDYLQDVSNNNVEDKAADEIADGNSIVIVNDDGDFVIVNDKNDYRNVNNGKVNNTIINNGVVNYSSANNNLFQNTGDRNANSRKITVNATGRQDAAGFGEGASVQSASRSGIEASDSSKAFPPESSSSSMPALPPPSFGAPPCFDSMQRETGPLCGDLPVGLFSWSLALRPASESILECSFSLPICHVVKKTGGGSISGFADASKLPSVSL